MLLVSSHIEKDESGHITLRRKLPVSSFPPLETLIKLLAATAQEDEDMWHAYNLIQQGDEIRGSAVR